MRYLKYVDKDAIMGFLRKNIKLPFGVDVDKSEIDVMFEKCDNNDKNWIVFVGCNAVSDRVIDIDDFEIVPLHYNKKWGEFVFMQLKLAESTGEAPYGIAEEYWDNLQKFENQKLEQQKKCVDEYSQL